MSISSVSVIKADNGININRCITSFMLTCDIFHLYPTLRLNLRDVTFSLASAIKIGEPFLVTLFKNNEENSSPITPPTDFDETSSAGESPTGENTASSNTIVIPMRVISFTKEKPDLSIDSMSVVLVHALAFEDFSWDNDELPSIVHDGNVSTIVSNMLSKIPHGDFLSGIQISLTGDSTRRRYQLKETHQSFLKRLMKYGYIAGEPIYSYIDLNNIFNLRGIAEFRNISTQKVLFPFSFTSDGGSPTASQNPETTSPRGYYLSFGSSSDVRKSHSRENVYLSDSNHIDSFGDDEIKFAPLYSNVSWDSEVSYPSLPSSSIYDTSLSPQDATALAIREHFENNCMAFSARVELQGFDDSFYLGCPLKIYFPFTEEELGNAQKRIYTYGDYFVTKISYSSTEQNSISGMRTTLEVVKF